MANSVASILKMHFRLLDSSDPRYAHLNKIYSKFSKNSSFHQCNFYFNGDINIIDSRDLILCLLRNGSIFISVGLLDILPNDKDISYLIIHELCHLYLRSTVKSLKYRDFFKLMTLDRKDYKSNREDQFDFLKKISFSKISRKQEDRAV